MSFSTYLEDATLNHFFRNTPTTSPTTVYLALFSADPGEGTVANELSGNGYARQPITFGAPADGAGSSRRIQNTGSVVFTSTGSAWTTATHASVMDAVSGGNSLAPGALAAPRTVDAGGTLTFAAGQITVSQD